MNTRFSLFVLLALSLKLASAATYYVDASVGNDQWSGKQASPLGSPATNGPWLSLARVSTQLLSPGDSVLLKCGGSWNQTLSIRTSGTASSPITYGVYPAGCTTPPQINGSTSIPASNWKQHSGNIYKATLPFNLVSNSTFDTGVSGWGKWSQANDATMSLSASCPTGNGNCMSFTSGTTNSLAISNNFGLNAGVSYKSNFVAKVPSGKTVWAIVRRADWPWDPVGQAVPFTGNGTWQNYSFPFTATAAVAGARLDFNVPAGVTIGVDNVRVDTVLGGAYGIFGSGRAVNIAHHPNRGHDPLGPDSLYYSIAQDSARTVVSGKTVSTSLTTGTDFHLPAGATLTPGTGIRIRVNDWNLDERKIASVSGSLINLDSPADYPLYKNWGYFLTGQLWMLDEPGESFYDATSNTVYVWMSDGQPPGGRVSIGQIDVGIDISSANYVVVDGLAVRNTGTGIRMNLAKNVTVRNMIIEDVLGRGVDAAQSVTVDIGTSRFTRTGRESISGRDGGFSLSNFSIHDNDISESGVTLNGNVVSSLPMDVAAAVHAGVGATVKRNSLRGMAYLGISPLQNSVVSDNYVENACLVLDDGGAIYLGATSSNSLIDHNTVIHAVGSKSGKPADHYTHAQGIYLDNHTSGVTVSNNTVVDAYYGILLHDAFNNVVQNNTLYGNRRYQFSTSEDSNTVRSTGDVYGNVVNGNRFFQTNGIPPVYHLTAYNSTADAAAYDSNLYFTLVSRNIAEEKWSTGLAAYSFPQWQSATTSSGTPRNLDPLGSEVNSSALNYALYTITGSNIVPNGNFAAGMTQWYSWNQTPPYGQESLVSCRPGRCIKYVAGASTGILDSPYFSIVQGQWYRLSFDLQGSAANQSFYAIVRRGGGGTNGYENLMAPEGFTATTGLRRYSIVFQSAKTINVNDPLTLDRGARVDFTSIQPGQAITVANVELVPISAVSATLRTKILVNPTATPASVDCPLVGAEATFCSDFVRFTDGQPVIWPYPLAPGDSEIIYTRDSTLTDADRDGIPDSQDTCASTPAGQSVNAKGCSFSQNYP